MEDALTEVATATGTATDPNPVPLRITPDALSQVMSILAGEENPDTLGLRVAVSGIQGVEYV